MIISFYLCINVEQVIQMYLTTKVNKKRKSEMNFFLIKQQSLIAFIERGKVQEVTGQKFKLSQ